MRLPVPVRRSLPLRARGLLAGALLLALSGCPKLPNPMAAVKEAARFGMATGAHAHAYQSYAFVYNFANGNANTHQQAIARIQKTGLPLLRALQEAGAEPTLVAESETAPGGYQAYAIHLDVALPGGKVVRIPGKQGASPAVYQAAVAAVSGATGVPAAMLQEGHGGWYHLTMVLSGLDAEAHTLQGHAFALQVLQERVAAGEQADWFDARRPAEQTIEDTNHALALLMDDVERVRAEQAAILATLALANHSEVEGALDAVQDELAATADDLATWRATHRQPTPEDFGVAWQVPDPRKIQAAVKDELGLVGAAIDVARGVATGDLPRTLSGLAAMAPPDTRLSAVASGVAAASKGDVKGTLAAIADLGGPDTKVGRVAARLEQAAGVLELAR